MGKIAFYGFAAAGLISVAAGIVGMQLSSGTHDERLALFGYGFLGGLLFMVLMRRYDPVLD